MRRGSPGVGLAIGAFFLIGGLALRQAGRSGWPLADAADDLAVDQAGDVFVMIGTIWAGVGGLLLLLFLVLMVAGGASGDDAPMALPTPRASRPPGGPPDVAEGLTRLAALKDRGLLTDDEWAQAKALFLGKPADHRQADAQVLEDLHDLYRAGGLTESEFNTKKWEILSRS